MRVSTFAVAAAAIALVTMPGDVTAIGVRGGGRPGGGARPQPNRSFSRPTAAPSFRPQGGGRPSAGGGGGRPNAGSPQSAQRPATANEQHPAPRMPILPSGQTAPNRPATRPNLPNQGGMLNPGGVRPNVPNVRPAGGQNPNLPNRPGNRPARAAAVCKIRICRTGQANCRVAPVKAAAARNGPIGPTAPAHGLIRPTAAMSVIGSTCPPMADGTITASAITTAGRVGTMSAATTTRSSIAKAR